MLINGCSVARSIEGTMVSTARSIEITKVRQFKSRVLMYSYATRGLGFLVHCATISRQLGQRSGGSPLFMINHRSSYIYQQIINREALFINREAEK